jgi:large subunit ribosomal protein L2
MLKKYKPTSPGIRHRVSNIFPYKGERRKKLREIIKGKTKTGGRNNSGKITTRHRGGGSKKVIRRIDHKYENGRYGEYVIENIEYDPNRSGHIALCKSKKNYFYRIAISEIEKGEKIGPIYSKERRIPKEGEVREIGELTIGQKVNCIEKTPGSGSRYIRAAGTYGTIVEKGKKEVKIEMPSKKIKEVSEKCLCTIGKISNGTHSGRKKGKAGITRKLGRRPKVRGTAMNAVDHPHGGNSNRTGGKGKPKKNI